MRKSKRPLISFGKDYFKYLDIEKGMAPLGQISYQRALNTFFEWLKRKRKEKILPHQLKEKDITNFRYFLSQKKKKEGETISRQTQNYYLIVLRSFLNFLTEKGILTLPPEKIKLAKIKKEREIKFLELKDIEKFLEAPNTKTKIGLRDKAILETLFSTGMRVSELVALNRDQIKIPKKPKDLEVTIVGKGGVLRPVYLSKRAVYWLKEYLKKRNDREKALFVSFKGLKKISRLTCRSIQKIVKKYALLSGLPSFVHPHTLRHSFATDLLSKGVDLRIVQEFLGHKNISTTQVYTHLTSKKLREIHRKFHGIKK